MAQNYYISFSGTGETTVVTSVKIENLTQGKTLEISGKLINLSSTGGAKEIKCEHENVMTNSKKASDSERSDNVVPMQYSSGDQLKGNGLFVLEQS